MGLIHNLLIGVVTAFNIYFALHDTDVGTTPIKNMNNSGDKIYAR